MLINFSCQTGSRLYGFHTDKSDWDYKGFGLPEPSDIIGLGSLEQIEWKNSERNSESTIFTLKKYLQVVLKGNPTLLEMCFSERKFHVQRDDIADDIIDFVRKNLITKYVFLPYHKYVEAQIKLINRQRVGSRAELVDKHGYDSKAATHVIRLAYQCIDLMRYGTFNPTLQGVQLEQCKACRQGEISKKELISLVESLDKRMVLAYNNSSLREAPDRNLVERKLMDVYFKHLLYKGVEYAYGNKVHVEN